jgi:hypothetical protein
MSDETEYEMSSDDFCLRLLSSRLLRYEYEIKRITKMLNVDRFTDTDKIKIALNMLNSIEKSS